MQAAAASRRLIDQETAEVLKRGLQPQPTAADRTDSVPTGDAEAPMPPIHTVAIATEIKASVTPVAPPPPKPKNKWITVPIRGRHGLFAHQRRPQPENVNAPTRYDVLAGQRTDAVDEKEQEKQELQVEEAVISELPATGETTGTPVPTPAELAQFRVLKKKPPPMLAEPQLMGLIQRERAHLLRLTVPCQSDRQPLTPLIRPIDTAFRSVDDMVDRLQLCAVPTPATGNCMAMAIVQALSDSALTAQDTKLAEAKGSLKRGIKHAGQLHLAEQFPHGTCVATLIAVRRGWAGMGPVASKQQFRWNLEEYGQSPSERKASVTAHNWGGCDTLCMAANFLRRNIYVIAKGGAGSGDWHCSLYRPSSISRHNKLIETGEQVILTAAECGQLIAQDKLHEDGQAPLVLRYHDNHYSACIHQHGVRPTSASGSGVGTGAHSLSESASSDVVMSEADGALSTWAAITPVVANDAILVGGHFDPWNTDLELDFWTSCMRVVTDSPSHRLNSAIHQILRVPDPQRFREMLTFLTSTVPHLEPSVQERLAHTDMTDATNIDIIQLQQQLHIAPCVVQQWQTFLQAVNPQQWDDDAVARVDGMESWRHGGHDVSDSTPGEGMECEPIGQSQIVVHSPHSLDRVRSSKRARPTTPDEPNRSSGQTHTALVLLQGTGDADGRAALTRPEVPLLTNGTWQDMWQSWSGTWESGTGIQFPTIGSSTEQWRRAVLAEPVKLLQILQQFPFRHPLLNALSDEVLEAWTAAWRRDCVHQGLMAYRHRTTDRATQGWLDDWQQRTTSLSGSAL